MGTFSRKWELQRLQSVMCIPPDIPKDMLLCRKENKTIFNWVKGTKTQLDRGSSTLNEGRVNSAQWAARKLLNKSFQWPQESMWGVLIAGEVKNPFISATAASGLKHPRIAGSLLPTLPLRKAATSRIRPFFNPALSCSSLCHHLGAQRPRGSRV